MAYIKRDSDGNIQAISFIQNDDCHEKIEDDHETIQIIAAMLGTKSIENIASDLAMVRVIEDLIDVLVSKSIVSINDLPQPVQLKLLKRKNLRTQGAFNIGTNDLIKL
jgi:hypothetical protein